MSGPSPGAGAPTEAASAELTAKVERRAATPIAGAVAGMLFAVLFGVSVTIISGTMADVAQRAGVSTATVSRVLSGHTSVAPEMRAKVAAAEPHREGEGGARRSDCTPHHCAPTKCPK